MASPNVTLNNITPPRVPLMDERTGLISREWYLFFLNIFTLVGAGQNTTSLTDLQVGPPPVQENITEIENRIDDQQIAPSQDGLLAQIAEMQKRIEGLEMLPARIDGLLARLADVTALNPSDGDKLIYNGTSGKWQQDSRSYLMLE